MFHRGKKINNICSQFFEERWDCEPDSKKIYFCSKQDRCANFHLVHKLILLSSDIVHQQKCIDKLKDMLESDSELANKELENGWTPLILILMNPRTFTASLFDLILEHSDMNCSDQFGRSPLILLARFGESMRTRIDRIVGKMVDKGVDIDKKDDFGRTAVMYASRYAKSGSSIEMVRELISIKVSLDLQDNEGWTALMLATKYARIESNVEVMKSLLDAGCDIDKGNDKGECPITLAFSSTNEALELLVNYGANLNSVDKNGDSILMRAIKGVNDKIVSMMAMRADLTIVNNRGETAFNLALNHKNYPLLKLMCDRSDDSGKLWIKNVPDDILNIIDEELNPVKKPKIVERKIIRNRGKKLNSPIERTVIIKVIEEKIQEDKFNGELDCVVCTEGPKSMCIDPCHHISVCKICAKSINRCPICRGDIDRIYSIYL